MSDDLRLLVYTFDSAGRADAARAALEAIDQHLGEGTGHVAFELSSHHCSQLWREVYG
jgi:hypothetical protein